VVPGCAHHITQRGNHRQTVFLHDQDRSVYLDLVKKNAEDCGVKLLGYCLMPNHVHWIALPETDDGLANTFGRAHHRYSSYFQAHRRTSGHLWQNRFYSCPLSTSHLAAAMLYVEQNPVRAGMASHPEEYAWSTARAHSRGYDPLDVADVHWWGERYTAQEWRLLLAQRTETEADLALERCTFAGKPCGEPAFVVRVSLDVGRDVSLRNRGRPRRQADTAPPVLAEQIKMANC
jgi:putative transposase